MARIAITPDYKQMHIRVRRLGDEEWTEARIALASPDGDSLALMLAGPVHAGDGLIAIFLPLLYDNANGGYIGVVIPDQYELQLLGHQKCVH